MENLKDVQIYPAQQITAGGETFKRGASIIKREYERQADKLKSTSPEAAKKLRETSAQVCECIENISNMQLLENYIHYFYDRTEYIWDYMDSGRVMLDDPERIFEILDLREQELKDDFKVLLERGYTDTCSPMYSAAMWIGSLVDEPWAKRRLYTVSSDSLSPPQADSAKAKTATNNTAKIFFISSSFL